MISKESRISCIICFPGFNTSGLLVKVNVSHYNLACYSLHYLCCYCYYFLNPSG